MTARARFKAVADRIPLPGETLAGVVVAMGVQRVRPLRLPAEIAPAGWMLACGGLAVVVGGNGGLGRWRSRQH